MSKLLRNSSPDALTRDQAVAIERKRAAERRRKVHQVRELAAQGRGSDTEVAHVARGELVVPRQLQNPEVMAALRRAAAEHNIPLEMLSIGSAMNRINPNTGAPELTSPMGLMCRGSGKVEPSPDYKFHQVRGPSRHQTRFLPIQTLNVAVSTAF